jgi:hypothetical protein
MPVHANPLSYRLRSLVALRNRFTVAIGVTRKYDLASPPVNMRVLSSEPVHSEDNVHLLS